MKRVSWAGAFSGSCDVNGHWGNKWNITDEINSVLDIGVKPGAFALFTFCGCQRVFIMLQMPLQYVTSCSSWARIRMSWNSDKFVCALRWSCHLHAVVLSSAIL